MPRRLRVTVDPERCVGNAMCVSVAPRTFALNAARQSEVVDPGGDLAEQVLQAASDCAVAAITVTDAETGERLFP
jgi:ferredoxin